MPNLNSRQSYAVKIKKLCIAGIFCALAFATTFIFHFKFMFLSFDIKDALVTLAGLLFGPIYSLSISVVVALLEFITIGDTGFWGLLMDILSTATFSTVCALIYKYKKNIWGAMIGLISSVFAMTAVMLVFNIFITPIKIIHPIIVSKPAAPSHILVFLLIVLPPS
jgi:riboflavin transporter FmnP